MKLRTKPTWAEGGFLLGCKQSCAEQSPKETPAWGPSLAPPSGEDPGRVFALPLHCLEAGGRLPRALCYMFSGARPTAASY